MADNTTLNAGSGGDIICTDQITTLNGTTIATGEKAQRVKVGFGVDATFQDVTAAAPLPVVTTNLDVALSTRLKPADTLAGVTTVSTVTAVTAITNALPAGTNKLGTVDIATAAATAKGTQGANGVPTQDLKDAGRVNWSAATAIAGVTAVTTEALVSMVAQRDGTAATAATSQAVTAAKRLRITSMSVGLISSAAAVISGRVSLRIGASAAATATSPIIHTLAIPSGAALAQAGGSMTISFPDGIEISGSQQIGVSQVCSVATGTLWVTLNGFEY